MIELVRSPPDEHSDILTDVCAVIARIILLAPPERQKEMCVLVLREINDIVEQVLDVNNIAPNYTAGCRHVDHYPNSQRTATARITRSAPATIAAPNGPKATQPGQ